MLDLLRRTGRTEEQRFYESKINQVLEQMRLNGVSLSDVIGYGILADAENDFDGPEEDRLSNAPNLKTAVREHISCMSDDFVDDELRRYTEHVAKRCGIDLNR